ncbi:AAA family ATPase [Dendronalium sp. ChiSLP03b]|uniref:AAA family ATPase n=1 Tax=Dendronalium sp. ChiSLP03b TaxID=3075381 RepID=UPI00391B18CA
MSNFTTASRFISVAAAALAIAGVASCLKTEGQSKDLSVYITLAASGVCVGSLVSSRLVADSANLEIKVLQDSHDNKLRLINSDNELLSNQLQKSKKQLKESQLQANKLVEQCQIRDALLAKKDSELIQLRVEIQRTIKDYTIKLELQEASAKVVKTEIKTKFKEALLSKLSNDYDNLGNSVISKIQNDYHLAVRSQLEHFLSKVRESYDNTCKYLSEIEELEGSHLDVIREIVQIYFQLSGEITSLRVKYRNLLNTETGILLERAMAELKERRDPQKFVPGDKARSKLREFDEVARYEVNELKNKVENSSASLDDLREQISDLLSQIDQKNLENENLKEYIKRLEYPILWRLEVTEAQRIGNKIIKYFAKKGIRLDRSHIDSDPYEPVVYFHANRLTDVVVADDLNKFSDYLQQHCEGVIEPLHFTYNGETGLFQCKIKLANKPKPSKEELTAKIPHCRSLVEKSKRGFLITGHPGAGKTSSMKAIAQWLGDEKTMRLALNPHSDDMSRFADSGFVELNDLDEIYEAIALLDEELKLRGQIDKSRRGLLIIAIDELGRILRDAPKGLDVMEILRQAAVEGRKLNIIILVGNHSQTTEAIEMDGQFRESFYQLFLVGAARYKINMPNAPAVTKGENDWIMSAAYPVLVGVDGRFKASQHPTHYTYSEFQDSGNPPVGLMLMSTNTVVLGYKTYLATFESESFSIHEQQLIDQNKHLVNLKTGAGLSRLIETVFNVKASKSDEYKRLKDQVLEYLKTVV